VWYFASRNAGEEQRAELLAALEPPPPPPDPDAPRVLGLAPPGVRRPKWWKGDKAAFESNVRAQEQLNERAQRQLGGTA
jgi:hypothetical protein